MSAKGFTLIELLVVITIIVIIGSIALLTFSQSLVKSRDNRRKADLQAISSALEIYYQKNSRYPCAIDPYVSTLTDPWVKDNINDCSPPASPPPKMLDTTYIDNVPKDPKQDMGDPVTSSTNITGYSYWTPTSAGCPPVGRYYILAAGLENVNDPDSDKNKNYQYCGTPPDLITRPDSNAFVIVSQ